MTRKEELDARFGASADDYATSASHRGGPDLDRMLELAAPTGNESVLDVATGAGNTALAFAPLVKHVVALDFADGMIDKTRSRFVEAGYSNGEFVVHDVEALPFESETFDLVTCRIAPHHFLDIERATREIVRVLKPGGRYIVVDSMAPADSVTAAFLHEVEARRDSTHVRSLSRSEWVGMLEACGLKVETTEVFRKHHDFEAWVARGGTTDTDMTFVRDRFLNAPIAVAAGLEIEVSGGAVRSFSDEKLLVSSLKSSALD